MWAIAFHAPAVPARGAPTKGGRDARAPVDAGHLHHSGARPDDGYLIVIATAGAKGPPGGFWYATCCSCTFSLEPGNYEGCPCVCPLLSKERRICSLLPPWVDWSGPACCVLYATGRLSYVSTGSCQWGRYNNHLSRCYNCRCAVSDLSGLQEPGTISVGF